jgi:subtilisin family serine protease
MPKFHLAFALIASAAVTLVALIPVAPAADPEQFTIKTDDIAFFDAVAATAAVPQTGAKNADDPEPAKAVVLLVEYKSPELRKKAVDSFKVAERVADYDRFVTVIFPNVPAVRKAALAEIVKAPGFEWLDPSIELDPPPPPTKLGPQLLAPGAEIIVQGGHLGRTGKGVVIAIVDTGLDFRHPDFVRTVGGKPESRLLAFWDTTREHKEGVGQKAPISYGPKGASVGTVFLQADLTADLRGEKKLDGNFDADGHGTACAGLAAGTGLALEDAKKKDAGLAKKDYRGVAPEADLIAIRVAAKEGQSFFNAWVLNAACDWFDQLAETKNRPVVISCSFGGQYGGRDGAFVKERWLSEWLRGRRAGAPARLVFIAAGNEAKHGIHSAAKFAAKQDAKVNWVLQNGQSALVELYIDAKNGPVDPKKLILKPSGATKCSLLNSIENPFTNSLQLRVLVTTPGGLVFDATDGAYEVHAYFKCGRDPMTNKLYGQLVEPTNECQIGTPATTEEAFAVASYDFNAAFLSQQGPQEVPEMKIGDISSYSNGGFLRKGKPIKPDFAAPGNLHTAPLPFPNPAGIVKAGDVDQTGRYWAFSGTSAATPYAAGVAALVLEKESTLSSADYRALLGKALSPPAKGNGKLPDNRWGYGKLDLTAVEKLLK